MGDYLMCFGTDSSPVLLNKEREIVATLKPILKGGFNFKDAGRPTFIAGTYNFSRNMESLMPMVYYVDENRIAYQFDLSKQLAGENVGPDVQLEGKAIGEDVEEFTIDRKSGNVYILYNSGLVEKTGTKLSKV